MQTRDLTIVAVACACAALSASYSDPARAADEVEFAPHRAVYEISLVNATAGSGVAGLTGRMVYELNGSSCEGYTQNMRFVTVMTNDEGSETLNDLRNSSWEAGGGETLRFSSSQYQNDVIAESAHGNATRPSANGQAIVEITKPAKKSVKLPARVYFPMQHATALIASAKAGRRMLKADVFDGSEKGEKYYLTSAVIGTRYGNGGKPLAAALKGEQHLQTAASWPITISYFEVGKDREDSTPTYELHFRYFENGVTSDLTIDYGAFAIKGALKELTFLAKGKCAATAH